MKSFCSRLAVLAVLLCAVVPVMAAPKVEHTAKMHWWQKARFGMFITWGLYSVPAGYWDGKPVPGFGEWIMNAAHIGRQRYAQMAKQFDPVKFNATQWVAIAKAAGMKYIVITAKHHEGFCMFHTKATRYNIVDATPWHKDPLALLAKACRRQGVRFCAYYSIMDWHSRDQAAWHPSAVRPVYNPTHLIAGRAAAYTGYVERQLREIIKQYHPGLLWFDGEWIGGWTPARAMQVYHYIRKLDPTVIINDRLCGGVKWADESIFPKVRQPAGNYITPEQHIPPGGLPGYWETCMTINNTWGYKRGDHTYKSVRTLLVNLIHCASGGGNYLLNVGPTGSGTIPKGEVRRLLAMGRWLKTNGAAIYGTHRSPFGQPLTFGYATRKKNKIYLEVTRWPRHGTLSVPTAGLSERIIRAYLLVQPKQDLPLRVSGSKVLVHVPNNAPDAIASVVVLQAAQGQGGK